MEPTRLDGEVHPVPLVAAIGFGAIALLGFGMIVFSDGGLSIGLVIVLIFGLLCGLFALECIPPWVELDDSGIRFRVKLQVRSVAWNEIAALGTGLANEEHPGSLLVRLTAEACDKRGFVRKDAMFHYDVPAVPSCRQDELLPLVLGYWQFHGGSGETFTLMGMFLQSSRDLRKAATDLAELQRRANPGLPHAIAMQTAAKSTGEDDVYCSVLHVRSPRGALFFCVIAGSDRLDALTSTIGSTVERLVREHRFNPEFEGEIQISLVPDLTPKTSALETRMDEFVPALEERLAKSGQRATGGNPIRISWAHGHPPKPDAS